MDRELKIGKYRHFKKGIYRVLGVAVILEAFHDESKLSRCAGEFIKAKFSEDLSTELLCRRLPNNKFSIEYAIGPTRSHDHLTTGSSLVIYKNEDESVYYARSLPMFLSEVDKVAYPDVDQKYRFEYIEENGES